MYPPPRKLAPLLTKTNRAAEAQALTAEPENPRQTRPAEPLTSRIPDWINPHRITAAAAESPTPERKRDIDKE